MMKKFTRKNKSSIALADVGLEQTAVAVTMLGKLADELGSKGHQGAELLVRQLGLAVIEIEKGRKRDEI
jgi:hypothetical protein